MVARRCRSSPSRSPGVEAERRRGWRARSPARCPRGRRARGLLSAPSVRSSWRGVPVSGSMLSTPSRPRLATQARAGLRASASAGRAAATVVPGASRLAAVARPRVEVRLGGSRARPAGCASTAAAWPGRASSAATTSATTGAVRTVMPHLSAVLAPGLSPDGVCPAPTEQHERRISRCRMPRGSAELRIEGEPGGERPGRNRGVWSFNPRPPATTGSLAPCPQMGEHAPRCRSPLGR